MFVDLLAGSTFISPVAKVAEVTVLDTIFVAITLADEFESNLHLLCESQRFYLDGLSLWTALRCYADGKCDLAAKEERRRGSQRANLPFLSLQELQKESIEKFPHSINVKTN